MLLRTLQRQAMTILGRLKYFKLPPVIVFDPSTYRVKGADVREVLNLIRPGDILLRAYDGYLDSWFIRHSWVKGDRRLARPAFFTHAALYVGRLDAVQRAQVASDINGYDWASRQPMAPERLLAFREEMRVRYFDSVLSPPPDGGVWPDNGMVVHAMADGVQIEDILSFCRCDYLQILRLPAAFSGVAHADLAPVFRLDPGSDEGRLAARLLADGTLTRDEAVALACRAALGKVGAEYDFDTNDIKRFQSFSCSQLVYYCYRAVAQWLDMKPRRHGFLGWYPERLTVTPEDFLHTGLETVWRSRSLRERDAAGAAAGHALPAMARPSQQQGGAK